MIVSPCSFRGQALGSSIADDPWPAQERAQRIRPPVAPGKESAGSPGCEPVLCLHCGRTASNGISCQGICVADSGY
jgi:hypothetical protein